MSGLTTTPNGSEPLEHHTVPQTYLRAFAQKPHGLLVFSTRRRLVDQLQNLTYKTVKKATTVRDFYTLVASDSSRDVAIEKRLSVLENEYPRIKTAVRSGKPLTGEQRAMIALLAAVQDTRTVNHQQNWSDAWAGVLDLSERMLRNTMPEASDAEIQQRLQQVVRDNFTSRDVAPTGQNLSLIGLGAALKVRHAIMSRMNMCILESAAHDFMTSDHPVTWINPVRYPPDPVYGFNFLHLANEVTYPLTPRHCVFMSYLPVVPRMKIGEELVRRVNARLVVYSRELYAKPTDVPVDLKRYALDIFASTNADSIANPITNVVADASESRGAIRLREVADELGQDWSYIAKENERFVRGLQDGGRDMSEVTWA
ncbi:MAG TPA: DUF4238 domain-containing protein [Candidatus Elarobacter sp.]|nr:DUF4238 domain-containing protein [Candidatus Elarobacter sp.]